MHFAHNVAYTTLYDLGWFCWARELLWRSRQPGAMAEEASCSLNIGLEQSTGPSNPIAAGRTPSWGAPQGTMTPTWWLLWSSDGCHSYLWWVLHVLFHYVSGLLRWSGSFMTRRKQLKRLVHSATWTGHCTDSGKEGKGKGGTTDVLVDCSCFGSISLGPLSPLAWQGNGWSACMPPICALLAAAMAVTPQPAREEGGRA